MSLSYARQTYSSQSISGGSTISLGGGMQLSGGLQTGGGGQFRVATGGPLSNRSPSVYGGAGGYGTRISQSHSVFSSGSQMPSPEICVLTNGKVTMQSLNDRLASYLAKVRSLEEANKKLELQIMQFCDSNVTVSRDFSSYYATISDLRAQIMRRYIENQRIILEADNAHLAAEDFKMKYEAEMNLRMIVDSDVTRLRGVRDSLTLSISDLEVQIEGLKEELAFMKTSHQEEMHLLMTQQRDTVKVDVDSGTSVDLTKVLEDMREQYEALVLKNKMELEKWFQSKVEILQTQIITCSADVKTNYTQLTELKRTFQSLEISRDSMLTQIKCMQDNLLEVKSRYSLQLSQLQMTINMLEGELEQLRVSLEQQKSEYTLLLDIKMRLQMEIAEYKRLLDGEQRERGLSVVISKTVEVQEEHKPHVERRVKTIVEEVVNGMVVSSTVDTQVEDIQ